MKKLISILISIFFACGEQIDEPERNFDFKIAHFEYHNFEQTRGIIFFYNDNEELLSYWDSFNHHDKVLVNNTDSTIEFGNNHYFRLDSNHRIIEEVDNNSNIIFSYVDNNVVNIRIYFQRHKIQESFYTYLDQKIKDSTVLYDGSGLRKSTIINTIILTDTICPYSVIHSTGLLNHPLTPDYLIRSIESKYYSDKLIPDSIHKSEYQYHIYENGNLNECIVIKDDSGAQVDQCDKIFNRFLNQQ
ncbi:MAG: hypothetical protein GX660_15795 [Clostridiaceae bacterium]|nr:hypothetical protein [Clostridiaceae bacterium]